MQPKLPFDKPQPTIASEALKKALLERAAAKKGYWPKPKGKKRGK